MLIRAKKKEEWAKYLQPVVIALNSVPNKKIGGLKPISITSPLQDPLIDEAKGKMQQIDSDSSHYKEWKTNQEQYDTSNSDLKVGSYVYTSFPKDPRYKGSDFQVILIFHESFRGQSRGAFLSRNVKPFRERFRELESLFAKHFPAWKAFRETFLCLESLSRNISPKEKRLTKFPFLWRNAG
jgi:hypothetical protein